MKKTKQKIFKNAVIVISIIFLMLFSGLTSLVDWGEYKPVDKPVTSWYNPGLPDFFYEDDVDQTTNYFNAYNESYLICKVQNTAYANFTFNNIMYNFSYGINMVPIDLGVDKESYSVNITQYDIDRDIFDWIAVQPVFIDEDEIEVNMDTPEDIPFYAGGPVTILVQLNFSYNNLWIEIDDIIINDVYSIDEEYPSVDPYILSGLMFQGDYIQYDLNFDEANLHQMRIKGDGIFNYIIITDGDWDYDGISNVKEIQEQFTHPTLDPLISNVNGFYTSGDYFLPNDEYINETFGYNFFIPYNYVGNKYLAMVLIKGTVSEIMVDGYDVFVDKTFSISQEGKNIVIPLGTILEGSHMVHYKSDVGMLYTEFYLDGKSILTRGSDDLDSDGDTIPNSKEVDYGIKPGDPDTDDDGISDAVDSSPRNYLMLDKDNIYEFVVSHNASRDTLIDIMIKRPDTDYYTEEMMYYETIGEVISIVPIMRLFGNSSISKTTLSSIWGKSIDTYSISGDTPTFGDPICKDTGTETYETEMGIILGDVSEETIEFSLPYSIDHDAKDDSYINIRFDIVWSIVLSLGEDMSDIIHYYDFTEDIELVSFLKQDVAPANWILASPDSYIENTIIWNLVQNPDLGSFSDFNVDDDIVGYDTTPFSDLFSTINETRNNNPISKDENGEIDETEVVYISILKSSSDILRNYTDGNTLSDAEIFFSSYSRNFVSDNDVLNFRGERTEYSLCYSIQYMDTQLLQKEEDYKERYQFSNYPIYMNRIMQTGVFEGSGAEILEINSICGDGIALDTLTVEGIYHDKIQFLNVVFIEKDESFEGLPEIGYDTDNDISKMIFDVRLFDIKLSKRVFTEYSFSLANIADVMSKWIKDIKIWFLRHFTKGLNRPITLKDIDFSVWEPDFDDEKIAFLFKNPGWYNVKLEYLNRFIDYHIPKWLQEHHTTTIWWRSISSITPFGSMSFPINLDYLNTFYGQVVVVTQYHNGQCVYYSHVNPKARNPERRLIIIDQNPHGLRIDEPYPQTTKVNLYWTITSYIFVYTALGITILMGVYYDYGKLASYDMDSGSFGSYIFRHISIAIDMIIGISMLASVPAVAIDWLLKGRAEVAYNTRWPPGYSKDAYIASTPKFNNILPMANKILKVLGNIITICMIARYICTGIINIIDIYTTSLPPLTKYLKSMYTIIRVVSTATPLLLSLFTSSTYTSGALFWIGMIISFGWMIWDYIYMLLQAGKTIEPNIPDDPELTNWVFPEESMKRRGGLEIGDNMGFKLRFENEGTERVWMQSRLGIDGEYGDYQGEWDTGYGENDYEDYEWLEPLTSVSSSFNMNVDLEVDGDADPRTNILNETFNQPMPFTVLPTSIATIYSNLIEFDNPKSYNDLETTNLNNNTHQHNNIADTLDKLSNRVKYDFLDDNVGSMPSGRWDPVVKTDFGEFTDILRPDGDISTPWGISHPSFDKVNDSVLNPDDAPQPDPLDDCAIAHYFDVNQWEVWSFSDPTLPASYINTIKVHVYAKEDMNEINAMPVAVSIDGGSTWDMQYLDKFTNNYAWYTTEFLIDEWDDATDLQVKLKAKIFPEHGHTWYVGACYVEINYFASDTTEQEIVAEKDGHTNVLMLETFGQEASLYVRDSLDDEYIDGIVEFWLYKDNYSIINIDGFITINENGHIINPKTGTVIKHYGIRIDMWNNIKIEFTSTTATTFDVHINGIKIGDDLSYDGSEADEIEFWISTNFTYNDENKDSVATVYIDAVDYSWENDYYEGKSYAWDYTLDQIQHYGWDYGNLTVFTDISTDLSENIVEMDTITDDVELAFNLILDGTHNPTVNISFELPNGFTNTTWANLTQNLNDNIEFAFEADNSHQYAGIYYIGMDLTINSNTIYYELIPFIIPIDDDFEITQSSVIFEEIDFNGNYTATFDFLNDEIGEDPVDWTIGGEPAYGDVEIISNLDSHNNVLEIHDVHVSGELVLNEQFSEGHSSGTIEFWLRTDDATKTSFFVIGDGGTSDAIYFIIGSDKFQYYNSGMLDIGKVAEDNTWYHIRINFELTTGNYMGLAQNKWQVYINNKLFGPFNDNFNPTEMDRIELATFSTDFSYYYYVDAIGYSWDSNYNIGENRYRAITSTDTYETPTQLEKGDVVFIEYNTNSYSEIVMNFLNDDIIQTTYSVSPRGNLHQGIQYQTIIINETFSFDEIGFSSSYKYNWFEVNRISIIDATDTVAQNFNPIDFTNDGNIPKFVTYTLTGELNTGEAEFSGDTGWVEAQTLENVDRDGERSWSNPSKAKLEDGSNAIADIDKNDHSDWLRLTDFYNSGIGYNIPSGAEITGIEVKIKRKGEETDMISDDSLRLRMTSGQIGNDKASGMKYTTTLTWAIYGSSSDDWSAGLTPDDLNSADFGIDLSCYNSKPNTRRMGYVDAILIKIHYLIPSTEETEDKVQVITIEPNSFVELDLTFDVLNGPNSNLIHRGISYAESGTNNIYNLYMDNLEIDGIHIVTISNNTDYLLFGDAEFSEFDELYLNIIPVETLEWMAYSINDGENITFSGNSVIIPNSLIESPGAYTIKIVGNNSIGTIFESNIINFVISYPIGMSNIYNGTTLYDTQNTVNITIVSLYCSEFSYKLDDRLEVDFEGSNTTLQYVPYGEREIIIYGDDMYGEQYSSGVIHFNVCMEQVSPSQPDGFDFTEGTLLTPYGDLQFIDGNYSTLRYGIAEGEHITPDQWGDFVFTKGSGNSIGDLEDDDADISVVDAEYTVGSESLLGIIVPNGDIITQWDFADATPHWSKLNEGEEIGNDQGDGGNIRCDWETEKDRWNFDTLTLPNGHVVTKMIFYFTTYAPGDDSFYVVTSATSGGSINPNIGGYGVKSIQKTGLNIDQSTLDNFWLEVEAFDPISNFLDINTVWVRVYTTLKGYSVDYNVILDVSGSELNKIYYDYRTTIALDCDLDIYNWDTTSWTELESNSGTEWIMGAYTLSDEYISESDEVIIRYQSDDNLTDFDMEIDQISFAPADLDCVINVNVDDPNIYEIKYLQYSHKTNISTVVNLDIWNWTNSQWCVLESINNYDTFDNHYVMLGNDSDYLNLATNSVKLRYQSLGTDIQLEIDCLNLYYTTTFVPGNSYELPIQPDNFTLAGGTFTQTGDLIAIDGDYSIISSSNYLMLPTQWGDFVFTKGAGNTPGDLEANDANNNIIDAELITSSETLLGVIVPDGDIYHYWHEGDGHPHWSKIDEYPDTNGDGGDVGAEWEERDRYSMTSFGLSAGEYVSKLVFNLRSYKTTSWGEVDLDTQYTGVGVIVPNQGAYTNKAMTKSGLTLSQAQLDAIYVDMRSIDLEDDEYIFVEALWVEVYTKTVTYAVDYTITWDITEIDTDNFYYDYRTTVAVDCDLDIYNWDTPGWEELESNSGTGWITDYYTLSDPYVSGSDEVKIRFQSDVITTDFDMELDQIVVSPTSFNTQVDIQIDDELCLFPNSISYSYKTNTSVTIDFDIWNWATETWYEIESVENYATFDEDMFIIDLGSVYVNLNTNSIRLRFQCITENDFLLEIDQLRLDYYKI
ncbi:hypothetical protein LCGC14_0485440 [marine sediment metagenome]|uniref:Uncharacterized protein n=1 Tax=marine sediment metagenome TaxID=412755 RepID=A0A0F9S807_9ZZZZ|nr:MAG: hypothetical protein Lokiarch_06560 [Candidatus Lokiarchaeum sp. GC14_75]